MRHALLVLACAALLAGLFFTGNRQRVLAEPAAVAVQWEYATLSFSVINNAPMWGVNAEGLDGAGAADEVYKKISGNEHKGRAGRRSLLDGMGAQGWELVEYDGGRQPLYEQVYYFKRARLPR